MTTEPIDPMVAEAILAARGEASLSPGMEYRVARFGDRHIYHIMERYRAETEWRWRMKRACTDDHSTKVRQIVDADMAEFEQLSYDLEHSLIKRKQIKSKVVRESLGPSMRAAAD